MRIVLLMVGKTENAAFAQAIDDYRGRVSHYLPFELLAIPALKNTRALSPAQQKEKEGELILRSLQQGDCCVLLDERGKEYTSEAFAAYIESKMLTAPRRLVFVVGGAYGFSREVYDVASESVSLSRMTFSHQMIRLLFVEQLYRAMTILRNEPYHHA